MPTCFMFGHSRRSKAAFIELLTENGVQALIDVRRKPYSRFSHFNRDALSDACAQMGVEYHHMANLGGFRKPVRQSPHTAFADDESWQGFCDHMDSTAGTVALRRLLELCRATRCAVMCSEADPEECHRQFIADWLLWQGIEVLHIGHKARIYEHEYSYECRVTKSGLVYDCE